ncbi:MAG: DNA-processing protein DprA [Bacteroidales bacterium]
MATFNDPSLKYKIAINLIPGIGGVLAKKLIESAGSPEKVFKSGKALLQKIPGIGKSLAENITNPGILEEAEREIEFISKYRIKALYYLDNDYPARLKECPDAPVILFVKGNSDQDCSRVVSIVGTRSASGYGLEFCRNLVSELAVRGHNPLIVSGLAYGIDICAHKAALDNGLQTVAVLAHGLSTIYPSAHRRVAEKICSQGALVTDFGSKTLPERGNFLKRNRIIAGLADATIVIESSIKGGALITADLANSYNRDVFALPGRVTDKRSEGCNNLIKINKAALIEKIEDIEYIMGWPPGEKVHKNEIPEPANDLNNEEKTILHLLSDNNQLSADHISEYTKMGASRISCLLLNLEFKGYVASMPGKIYRLKFAGNI